jgi:hypothetical protein
MALPVDKGDRTFVPCRISNVFATRGPVPFFNGPRVSLQYSQGQLATQSIQEECQFPDFFFLELYEDDGRGVSVSTATSGRTP